MLSFRAATETLRVSATVKIAVSNRSSILVKHTYHDEILLVGHSWGGSLLKHNSFIFDQIRNSAMSREPLDQSRKLVTELPGPKAREMRESLDTYVPKGVSPSMPAFAARAEGGIVEDVDGNRLIDLGSGIAV